MNQIIYTFLSNRKDGEILIRNSAGIAIANKKNMRKITLLMAELGFGKASLKSVARAIVNSQEPFAPGTHARFNRYLKIYNKNRILCWKRAKITSPASLTKSKEYRAEALFLQILTIPPSPGTMKELTQLINELAKAILPLNPKDRKLNKSLFNDILAMKARMKPHQELKPALRNLKTVVLKVHFAKRLGLAKIKVDALERKLPNYTPRKIITEKGRRVIVPDDEAKPFLSGEIERYKKDLAQGKIPKIPKWNHCTPKGSVACRIVNSRLKYMHRKAYPGVFVSGRIESYYGAFGIVMTDHIEKTGTRLGRKRFAKLPKTALGNDPTLFGEFLFANLNNRKVWLSFQKASGVPLKRRKDSKKLLEYYKDNSLAYICFDRLHATYRELSSADQKKCNDAKIRIVTMQEAEAMRAFIDSTYSTAVPAEWKGKIKRLT